VIVRILVLAAVVLLILRLIGKWRQLTAPRPPGPMVEAARKCPDCGTYVLGSDPEPCGRADCPSRRAG
jgi:hypothetical protein